MKFLHSITFDSPPVLFCAWPGMGNVGLMAADYLRRKLGATVFAEIEMESFFIPDSIVVESGVARLPDVPSSRFHYHHHPDCLIFESDAQVSGRESMAMLKTIFDVAEHFQVSRIYTAAAYALTMSHTQDSEVLCACNSSAMLESLQTCGVIPMPDGSIAGLNGVALGIAAQRGYEAACFLGTIPSYAANLAYPKASLAIIRMLQKLLSVQLDLVELEDEIAQIDKQLETIEERIREFFPMAAPEQQEELSEVTDDEVPKYIMRKIEMLFEEVKRDRSRASELKDELVRWNLYDLYEHRFLDIFKTDR